MPTSFEDPVKFKTTVVNLVVDILKEKQGQSESILIETAHNDYLSKGGRILSIPEIIHDTDFDYGGIDPHFSDTHNDPSSKIWAGLEPLVEIISLGSLHLQEYGDIPAVGLVDVTKVIDEFATYVDMSVFVDIFPMLEPTEIIKDLSAMADTMYGMATDLDRLAQLFLNFKGDYLDKFGTWMLEVATDNLDADDLVKRIVVALHKITMKLGVELE